MIDPNTLTAIAALSISVLVGFAWWPHIAHRADDPIWRMGMAVFIFVFTMSARILYWDLAQHLFPDAWAHLFTSTTSTYFTISAWINAGFNVLWIVGAYLVLSAMYFMIPAHQQKDWSVWTAAFYPDRLKLFSRFLGGRK